MLLVFSYSYSVELPNQKYLLRTVKENFEVTNKNKITMKKDSSVGILAETAKVTNESRNKVVYMLRWGQG